MYINMGEIRKQWHREIDNQIDAAIAVLKTGNAKNTQIELTIADEPSYETLFDNHYLSTMSKGSPQTK